MFLKKLICFIMLSSTSLCCSCLCEDASSNIDYFQDSVNGIYEIMENSNENFWVDEHGHIHIFTECPGCGRLFWAKCSNPDCPLKQKATEEKKDTAAEKKAD